MLTQLPLLPDPYPAGHSAGPAPWLCSCGESGVAASRMDAADEWLEHYRLADGGRLTHTLLRIAMQGTAI